MRAVPALALAILVVPLEIAAAQVTVRGIVYDSLNRRPLADAAVSVPGTRRFGTTDANGRFTIDSVAVSTKATACDAIMRDFADHQRVGLGKFITRDVLEQAKGRDLAGVLQQHFSALTVYREPSSEGARLGASRR